MESCGRRQGLITGTGLSPGVPHFQCSLGAAGLGEETQESPHLQGPGPLLEGQVGVGQDPGKQQGTGLPTFLLCHMGRP